MKKFLVLILLVSISIFSLSSSDWGYINFIDEFGDYTGERHPMQIVNGSYVDGFDFGDCVVRVYIKNGFGTNELGFNSPRLVFEIKKGDSWATGKTIEFVADEAFSLKFKMESGKEYACHSKFSFIGTLSTSIDYESCLISEALLNGEVVKISFLYQGITYMFSIDGRGFESFAKETIDRNNQIGVWCTDYNDIDTYSESINLYSLENPEIGFKFSIYNDLEDKDCTLFGRLYEKITDSFWQIYSDYPSKIYFNEIIYYDLLDTVSLSSLQTMVNVLNYFDDVITIKIVTASGANFNFKCDTAGLIKNFSYLLSLDSN